ncbi:type II toxin-antitoxin system VapC family toxin [Achromobacter sp. LC458]|uniref:hypothetical protein n=1 Tax=unclassified Achromobacter TaxID=2626865 RepID=UPI00062A14B7|nr:MULTISPECIES: hypothetical protein [unclassified Achromobacter]MDX3985169.1 hypothetical protein [Achromobacter sp.]TRM54033.1 type II toxin-antitoxin system VapC family toxin [Achromobacter sp. LC458]HBL64888.1 hypothetical protein [Achromobacter sp.]HCQ47825.1 hypothetical protein [Achromobacter sp.]
MTAAVLLDTSYLISLVDATRPNHQIATRYFRQMLDESLPIYFSAVVAAEFGIKQALTDLPLQKFRHLPFNIPHGQRAAQLWNALGPRGDGTGRAVARDDIKLIAQACHERIPFVLNEDASSLHKYCERLREAGVCQVRSIVLASGYDPAAFRMDGQQGFDLSGEP